MIKERFSGRAGLIFAALGMAIGTGNLWRFPREVARFEGGAFLIPWLVFLFTWSIPILIAEFTLGKVSQRGPIGAFAKLLGPRTAWMGAFMALVTLGIATYYSVVSGWTLKYLIEAILHKGTIANLGAAETAEQIAANHDAAAQYFTDFANQPSNWEPVWFHLGSVALVSLIVWRGVKWGVELACKIMLPILFVLLIGGTVWVLMELEGSEKGLHYFFTPNWDLLTNPSVWIAGLAQSAWSTGAGWALILTYGAYARKDEDAVVNNAAAGLGNNLASLLAGLFIFPAVFSLLAQAGMQDAGIAEALKDNGTANTGLAFTYIPFIFAKLGEVGGYCTIAFFVALFFAAISSLIAMYELGVRVLGDMGLSRSWAVLVIAVLGGGAGVFSAHDLNFFATIDWICSIGLIVGGLMVAWAVQHYGTIRFRDKLINPTADIQLRTAFNWLFVFAIPAQGLGLLAWFLVDAAGAGWDPFALGTYNAGAPVFWLFWTAIPLIFFSPWIGRLSLDGDPAEDYLIPVENRPNLWLRLLLLPIPYLATVPVLRDWCGKTLGPWMTENVTTKLTWVAVAAFVGVFLVGGFLFMIITATRTEGRKNREARAATRQLRREELREKMEPNAEDDA